MRTLICVLIPAWLALPIWPGSKDTQPNRTPAVIRFLARPEPQVTSAVAWRHLEATTRGGAMSGWIDVCTTFEGADMQYWIVAQGGSGAVRKRALIAALDGEVKARKEPVSRAALDPSNYEFAPEIIEDGVLRVGLTPKRKDTLLIQGAMFLSPDEADLLRLEGRLVKPPSFWTRQVTVVRRYARTSGVRVPVSMESTAKILVVGTSTFSMNYRYRSINGDLVPQEAASDPDAQVCDAPPVQKLP